MWWFSHIGNIHIGVWGAEKKGESVEVHFWWGKGKNKDNGSANFLKKTTKMPPWYNKKKKMLSHQELAKS